MTPFFARIFIKNHNDTKNPAVRRKYGLLSGISGIICNLFLFLGKFAAGSISGSVSITADAFNNLSDIGSSLVTLLAWRISGKAPDKKHPFGYGRAEYVSGLIVSFIILFLGVELMQNSVSKITSGEGSSFNVLSVCVLCASMLVKLWMYLFNRRAGKLISSPALFAVAFDSVSDIAATFAVLISVIVSYFANFSLDGYIGAAVSLFIMYGGIKTALDALNPLIGQAPDPKMIREIETRVLAFDRILGVHDIILHNYGPGHIIASLHAEISSELTLIEAHEQIDKAEKTIGDALSIELVIHLDPILVNDKRTDLLREVAQNALKEIHPDMSLHDFRVADKGKTVNLIFDAVIPSELQITDEEALSLIQSLLAAQDSRLNAVVTLDRNYIGGETPL